MHLITEYKWSYRSKNKFPVVIYFRSVWASVRWRVCTNGLRIDNWSKWWPNVHKKKRWHPMPYAYDTGWITRHRNVHGNSRIDRRWLGEGDGRQFWSCYNLGWQISFCRSLYWLSLMSLSDVTNCVNFINEQHYQSLNNVLTVFADINPVISHTKPVAHTLPFTRTLIFKIGDKN